MNLQKVKHVLAHLDTDYLVDILGITPIELIERFTDKVIENLDSFDHILYNDNVLEDYEQYEVENGEVYGSD